MSSSPWPNGHEEHRPFLLGCACWVGVRVRVRVFLRCRTCFSRSCVNSYRHTLSCVRLQVSQEILPLSQARSICWIDASQHRVPLLGRFGLTSKVHKAGTFFNCHIHNVCHDLGIHGEGGRGDTFRAPGCWRIIVVFCSAMAIPSFLSSIWLADPDCQAALANGDASTWMDGVVAFAVDAGVDASVVEGRRAELLAWRLVVRGRDPMYYLTQAAGLTIASAAFAVDAAQSHPAHNSPRQTCLPFFKHLCHHDHHHPHLHLLHSRPSHISLLEFGVDDFIIGPQLLLATGPSGRPKLPSNTFGLAAYGTHIYVLVSSLGDLLIYGRGAWRSI